MFVLNKKRRGRVGVSSLLWVTKMRVAALYLVAAAFVIAMSTPGPLPQLSGGALAISFGKDDQSDRIEVASNPVGAEYGLGGMRGGLFDSDFRTSISINAASSNVSDVKDHPAARRYSELTAMLAAMTPPNRTATEIDAELADLRGQVDTHQGAFDTLASELEVLRVELSEMDRREAATEIAARIDLTQSEADEARSDLVHALITLTSAQAELKNARRFEDLQSELVALEEMMMSVQVYVDLRDEDVADSSVGGRFFSDFRGLFDRD